MEQVIYGDTLFLVNASMDFLALFLTCRILWRRARPVPLSIAAVLGGVYGVASLFLQGNIVVGFLLHIATAVLLCAVGIGVDDVGAQVREALKQSGGGGGGGGHPRAAHIAQHRRR